MRAIGGWRFGPTPLTRVRFTPSRTRARIGPLTVALVSDTTGQPVATATVQGISTEWKRYEFTLTTGSVQPSAENHLLLTVGHAGKLWLDLVSLFPPTYKNRENGNRVDLMEMLAAHASEVFASARRELS